MPEVTPRPPTKITLEVSPRELEQIRCALETARGFWGLSRRLRRRILPPIQEEIAVIDRLRKRIQKMHLSKVFEIR